MVNSVERSFHALGHSARRSIVERLARGPATVGEAAAGLEISKPAVTKHLKVLEAAGIVSRRVEGRTHVLQLSAAPLGEAEDWIEHHRRLWEAKFDEVDRYLKEEG